MDSEVAATNTSSSHCSVTIPSTATTTSGDAVTSDSKEADGLHGDDKRPLQIHDQCHVQWYGTNHNSRMDSNNKNGTTTSKQQQVTTAIGINLPAIVVERRIARKKTKRQNDKTEEDTTTSSNRNNVKRQRNSIGRSSGNSSSSTNLPWLDVTTVKKEMYDTLPADALEYYVHYSDHDRYVCDFHCMFGNALNL